VLDSGRRVARGGLLEEVDVVRRTGSVAAGVVVALAGLLFTLQGVGVVQGSAMSGTTFWTVAGPVIVVVGLVLVWAGLRGRAR
jgi:hypothetical protein